MNLSKKEKTTVNKNIRDIVMFQLRILKMEPTLENINLAITMFIEGVRYLNDKTEMEWQISHTEAK